MVKKQYIDEYVVYDGEYTPDSWEDRTGIKKPKAGICRFLDKMGEFQNIHLFLYDFTEKIVCKNFFE